MKSFIHSFKSFVGYKPLFLLENKEEQFLNLEKCIEDKIVFLNGAYGWSEQRQTINFDELTITDKFKGKSLDELPFKVGACRRFISHAPSIINLKGSPLEVKEMMDISYGELKSLDGCPEVVPDFTADYNVINSLKGGPKFVGGNFNLENNLLENLDYGPYIIIGKPRISYNPRLERVKVDNMNIVTLFNKMHEDIARLYAFDENGEAIKSKQRIFENVRKAIEAKDYLSNILIKNPSYKIFLSGFGDDHKDWEFLQGINRYGFLD
jgi:hypothetical protein